MILKIKLTFILLLLVSCFRPELFTIGGFKVTAGTAVTVPAKIEAYEKYKEENKKRIEVEKINDTTLEIYY